MLVLGAVVVDGVMVGSLVVVGEVVDGAVIVSPVDVVPVVEPVVELDPFIDPLDDIVPERLLRDREALPDVVGDIVLLLPVEVVDCGMLVELGMVDEPDELGIVVDGVLGVGDVVCA